MQRAAAGSPVWEPPGPSCAVQDLRGSVLVLASGETGGLRARAGCFGFGCGVECVCVCVCVAVLAVPCLGWLAGGGGWKLEK